MADQNVIREYLIRLGYKVEGEHLLEETGRKAQNIAGGLVKAVGTIAGFTLDMASDLDKLYLQAAQAGADPLRFRAMAVAAEQVGVSAGAMGNMLVAMGQKLRSDPGAQVYLKGLGIQANDSTEAFMGMLDYIDKIRSKLKPGADQSVLRNVTNQFASMMGIDPAVMDTILLKEKEYRAAVQARTQDAKNANLDKDSLEQAHKTMVEFRQEADKLKVTMEALAVRIMPLLTHALEAIGGYLDGIGEKLDKLSDPAATKKQRTQAGLGLIPGINWGASWFDRIFGTSGDAPTPVKPDFYPAKVPSKPKPKLLTQSDAAGMLMQSLGLDRETAAAFIGNFMQESGLNPAATNRVGGGHWGIAQWGQARARQFATVMGKPVDKASAAEQMQFIVWELQNTEKGALAQIQAASGLAAKSQAVRQFYERPGLNEANDPRRLAFSQRVLAGLPAVEGAKTLNQNVNVTVNAPGGDGHEIAKQVALEQSRANGDAIRYFNGHN